MKMFPSENLVVNETKCENSTHCVICKVLLADGHLVLWTLDVMSLIWTHGTY
jgi:hypothetical protein